MAKFVCESCKKEFRADTAPNLCPFCGEKKLDVKSKQRETALRLISELVDMKSEHDRILEEYAEIRAAIEYRHQMLRKYKQRGVISAEEMPVFEKPPKVAEYLKEYRNRKRSEKDVHNES